MYEELIKRLWECVREECWNCSQHKDSYDGQRTCADNLMKQAADAIEELKDLVARAIGFLDSLETVNALRSLNSYMPDITDPEWQKAHMEVGFYSPIGEVYKEMGVYGEPPKEET